MALSTQTVVSDGTLVQLSLSIDFVYRSSIQVYFDNIEQNLGSTWVWVGTTGNTIAFSPAVPNAAVVLVRRFTDLSSPTHQFNAGAQFNELALDDNFTQVLHAAQEAADGSFVRESFNDFDMHLNLLKNVADGIAPKDAVNKSQLDAQYAAIQVGIAALAAVQPTVDTINLFNEGFLELAGTITSSRTITAGKHALSIAPIIAAGVVVTVPAGALWVTL